MSAGGVFTLITNDGKADKMLMATELLNQRIRDIKCSRQKHGFADPTPTLVDIEKTHILFINAHFKPFAALGFEYGKVNVQSGSASLARSASGRVQFSIPQFGDFFNDMAINIQMPAVSCNTVQWSGVAVPGGQVTNTVGGNPVTAIPGTGAHARGLTGAGNVVNLVAGVNPPAVAALTPFAANTTGLAFANIPETWIRGFPLSATGAGDVPDLSAEAAAMGFTQPFGSRNADVTNATPVPETYSLSWSYVWADGSTPADADPFRNWICYADLPAARMLKQVDFTVNNNPLDQYKSSLYVMYDQFAVASHKKDAWRRCLGQEVAKEGYSAAVLLPQVANPRLGPDGVQGTPDDIDASNVCRQKVQIVKGYQTPKPVQNAFEAWAPLLFWFNKDVRLSIPSVSIPYGQRFITIDIAPQDELLFAVPGLFVKAVQTLKTFDIETAGAADPVMLEAQCDVQVKGLYIPGSSPADQTISVFELYINNIFVNPEIHDIYIHRIGFSLVRVHRFQEQQVNTAVSDLHMVNFKWPIEYVYIGLQPTSNQRNQPPTAGPTSYYPDSKHLWRRYNYALREECSLKERTHVPFNTVFNGTGTIAAGEEAGRFLSCVSEGCCASMSYNERRMIDTLRITAHGNILVNSFPSTFFNYYTPYTYGGVNVSSPDDIGALFVTFCLYPGTYQPSSHINVSRAREFYVQYASSFLGSAVSNANFLGIASAINFLLISDGSAVLRYST